MDSAAPPPTLPDFDAATDTLIDAYLLNQLTPEQTAMFDKRLEQDPKLLEEVRLRQDIIIGIKAAERKYIRRILEDPNFARQENPESAGATTPLLKKPAFWVVAAAVAAGLAFALAKWVF
jgi:anti-sigma factor RsiW